MAEAPHPLDDPHAPGAVRPAKPLSFVWRLAALFALGGAIAIIGEHTSLQWLRTTGGATMLVASVATFAWWRWKTAAGIRDEIRDLLRFGTRRVDPPAIVTLPVVGGKVMIVMYMALFLPLMYLEEAARDRDWVKCAVIGVAWAVAFPPLALVFHRRSMVHIAVSIFAWLAVCVGFPLAILLRT